MIYGEQPGRYLHHDGKGLSGSMVFLCDWTDVDPAPIAELPKYGDVWIDAFGQQNKFLRCVDVTAEEDSTGKCRYTAQFSTQGETESYYELSVRVSCEPGPQLTGHVWVGTQTPVIDVAAPPVPVMILDLKMRRSAPPYLVLLNNVNKTNDRTFLGFERGHVLFLGADVDTSTSIDGNIIDSRVTYHFSVRARSHKYFWRPPLQALDVDGQPLVYQNIDSEQPNYTTDESKIATPVWVSGDAGVGGWDVIHDDDGNAYFDEVDLATELDIQE